MRDKNSSLRVSGRYSVKSFLIFCTMVLILSACQTTASVQKRVVAAYDDMVFDPAPDFWSGKYEGEKSKAIRWEQKKVSYHVKWDGVPVDHNLVSHIKTQLGIFSGLTSLHFSEVQDASDADLNITVENEKEFIVNGNQRGTCYANTQENNSKTAIISANIHLPGKDLEFATYCFSHEVMHAIGFAGHSYRLKSIMASSSDMKGQLSQWDRYIVAGHYAMNFEGNRYDRAAKLEGFNQYLKRVYGE